MTISAANGAISLQESQLLYLLQQQSNKARAAAQKAQNQAGATRQDLPTGTKNAAQADAAASVAIDPALTPENITALLRELQTQQASLDTTLRLDGSGAGPGGRTLLDYLNAGTTGDNLANETSNDNDGDLTLLDYLS